MPCNKCGESCHGRLCSICEQIQLNEKMYGSGVDDGPEIWSDEDGQTTLTDGDDE